MAEKLRSILKRTNWSLVLKAVIFGVAWWALPFWLFLLIALYLYFIPLTGTGKVAAPFFVLLLISLFQNQNALAAVLFAALFYFIILIKDLLIIDRRTAHEVLMLVLSYLLVRSFFLKTGGSLGGWALLYSLIVAWAVSALITSFVKNFSPVAAGAPEQDPAEAGLREARLFRGMLGWMTFLLMWQLLIVGMFLPLDFLYQSAIVFLVAAILIDLVPQYVFGELSRIKVLATGTVLFALLTIVAASARWVL
ncbi:MAG TPA: hypothetical protein VMR99_02655 [Candidatus Paceibacterota bacterium]|nr:hypothetical protein [Candidatus Paceibacterota bacterium]